MTVGEIDNDEVIEGPESDPSEGFTKMERSYPICGARKSQGGDPSTQKAGWGTDHVGIGKCKLHGGKSPIRHGRYSGVSGERIRESGNRGVNWGSNDPFRRNSSRATSCVALVRLTPNALPISAYVCSASRISSALASRRFDSSV